MTDDELVAMTLERLEEEADPQLVSDSGLGAAVTLTDAILAAIAVCRANDWHDIMDVTDDVLNNNTRVLLYDRARKQVIIGWPVLDLEGRVEWSDDNYHEANPSHWMPLPDPPA